MGKLALARANISQLQQLEPHQHLDHDPIREERVTSDMAAGGTEGEPP